MAEVGGMMRVEDMWHWCRLYCVHRLDCLFVSSVASAGVGSAL